MMRFRRPRRSPLYPCSSAPRRRTPSARGSFELDSAGRCGDLDSAVEGDRVWMTCTCGAVINRSADDD
jgi:hypothetical protein